MIRLKYGNTNTFYVSGINGGLLVDTDYAGTLPAFFRALKANHLKLDDISYVLPTHCHPDHIGLVGELQKLGVKLLLIDCQLGRVHYADEIFGRDIHLRYVPVDEKQARISEVRAIICRVSYVLLRGRWPEMYEAEHLTAAERLESHNEQEAQENLVCPCKREGIDLKENGT